MKVIVKLTAASIFAASIAAPVLAQNPKQGDYYRPTQTPAPQVSPAQEQRIKQGDYYKPSTRRLHSRATAAQVRRIQQGDYYKPGRY